jgi:dihydrofolate reductase
MRELILQMQYTLDGFVSGPNGELDWIFPDFDDEFAAWETERLWEAGAHLMGSVTYYDMAAHWPASDEPYAAPMNQIPKIVFSRSIKKAHWGETRIVPGDLGVEIRRLKQQSGKDLMAHGGVRFAQSLIRTGLIDLYRLIVHPVALGKGQSLFSAVDAHVRFKPVGETTFKTGIVVMELRPEYLHHHPAIVSREKGIRTGN